jgi:hypothetical protein
MELEITVGLLLFELAILARCYVMQKRPADPARPRLIPYGAVMGFVIILMLATLAHIISLMTGHQVVPRTGKYGR